MTPSKRLLRHRGTAPDPFVFHSTAVVPKAHHYYPVIPRGGRPSLRRYVDDGSGGFLRSGTNAPFLPCHFPSAGQKFFENADKYERRLATALEIDPAARTLSFAHQQQTKTDLLDTLTQAKTRWNGTEWVNPGPDNLLDAPFIRDDYYSSILAYSATSQTLFIALFDRVYAWPEGAEGDVKRVYTAPLGAWVFSVAVSSYGGGKSILAVGCSNNQVILASPAETLPRFEVLVPAPVHCVSWRPTSTLRRSKHPSDPPRQVRTEDLLVGTSYGIIYYYVVEWPHAWEVERDNWSGAVSMVSRIVIHTDKICAIVWSPDGQQFASGANDNLCCLFETSHAAALRDEKGLDGDGFEDEGFVDASFEDEVFAAPTAKETVKLVLPGSEKQWWPHDAAIKAIAFCPWQDGLVATGGGAEDRCIYFFHTRSGAALATIAVGAQVTGLVWSRTRREIAATLGFTNPERHPYRIAVFSWPECRLVGAIRREADYRILCAIHFPSQGQKDGPLSEDCIVVASSTHQVEFYNLWEAGGRRAVGGQGCLGGSDILESIEGIEKEGDVIR
ncbi:WD40 repeat-like protein [Sodiomyces alkalinus F11]|uniref:WD40 repeat-like protein n=1 Tax=Sodiomyces alkalinus (strain CBS 110278 / VKM F-3762 / F11) TaxID=1314773 RepID=A0A3N2Q0M9_SODAK|nr:WD40 repeat-like protein [Sodiomyces alkalinus F11]ROT40324.1 WD40 repeat-like protein [Sodiomyces alkalinus F11]